jgi:hypothetical protein
MCDTEHITTFPMSGYKFSLNLIREFLLFVILVSLLFTFAFILGNNNTLLAEVDDGFTVSLLHFDGVDASTNFIDESGKPWSAYDNAQLDTSQAKFGTASLLLDGIGDCIETPDTDDYYLNGDFTIDFFVQVISPPVPGQSATFFSQYTDINNGSFMNYYMSTDNTTHVLRYILRSAGVGQQIFYIQNLTLNPGTWYHLALTRSGNDFRFFRNGLQVGNTQTSTLTYPNLVNPPRIGCYESSYFLNGWIDEFRVSKGIARWTSNFTVPTGPYEPPPTPTPTVTNTPTPTLTNSPTPIITDTPTPILTQTPVPTSINTPIPTNSTVPRSTTIVTPTPTVLVTITGLAETGEVTTTPNSINNMPIQVLDENGNPLANATVHISYKSDSKGYIYLNDPPSSDSIVSIEHNGQVIQGKIIGENIVMSTAISPDVQTESSNLPPLIILTLGTGIIGGLIYQSLKKRK